MEWIVRNMEIIKKISRPLKIFLLGAFFFLTACGDKVLNNPHDSLGTENVYYGTFSEPPKTLDPARSYSSDEILFIAQIYEPPLQYHYLKRPYELMPLTANKMPSVQYFDSKNRLLAKEAPDEKIAYSVYEIGIKPGIFYQPHPAFSRDAEGNYRYHHLKNSDVKYVKQIKDFKLTENDTRELTAEDYVYQIKRLAAPHIHSPIYGFLNQYIFDLETLNTKIEQVISKNSTAEKFWLDLRNFPFEGAEVVDRYTYRIKIKGKYPQFMYWLATLFFAPLPWEVDAFYSQSLLKDKNITLNQFPVGTGPYQIDENNPNRRIILKTNPFYHEDFFPESGDVEDIQRGFLKNAGQRLPFVDSFVFSLEKEAIPRWNKFLQGYYDASAINSDSFDQAIQIDREGNPFLTKAFQKKAIQLQTSVGSSIFYIGFNMLDDVVGGDSESARKLRQAISIALNFEEFIAIFLNGRGLPAFGPIPPGVYGYQEGEQGINPYVYTWAYGHAQRRSLQEAKKLLAEAGYPNGVDPKTGKALILNYDVPSSPNPDDKARLDWMRKQFATLGIALNVRATLYNRFQEKMRLGNAQIFMWGWSADYPDPENFLFLLYGPNGKVKFGGENASNYHNPKFDVLFKQFKYLEDGPEKIKLIEQMVRLVQHDAPWVFGLHPKNFQLFHQWVDPVKPNEVANNLLKYVRIHPKLREHLRAEWNQPVWWPAWVLLVFLVVLVAGVWIHYWRRAHARKKRLHE